MWCQIFSSVLHRTSCQIATPIQTFLILGWSHHPIIPLPSHTQDSYCSFCKQKDETKQCQKPSKPFKTSQKNSCLRCASLHVIPIGDNAMLDGVLQCQHTSLALGFISNIAVLLVHANHNSGHLWSADDGWENCSRSIITSKTSLAHSTSVVHHQSSHLFVTHGYKLRLQTVKKLDKLESLCDLGKITWATNPPKGRVFLLVQSECLFCNDMVAGEVTIILLFHLVKKAFSASYLIKSNQKTPSLRLTPLIFATRWALTQLFLVQVWTWGPSPLQHSLLYAPKGMNLIGSAQKHFQAVRSIVAMNMRLALQTPTTQKQRCMPTFGHIQCMRRHLHFRSA